MATKNEVRERTKIRQNKEIKQIYKEYGKRLELFASFFIGSSATKK